MYFYLNSDRNPLADPSWQSKSRHLLEPESHLIEEDLGYNNQVLIQNRQNSLDFSVASGAN